MSTTNTLYGTSSFIVGGSKRLTVSLWYMPTGTATTVFKVINSVSFVIELALIFTGGVYQLQVLGTPCLPAMTITASQWNLIVIAADYSGFWDNNVPVSIQIGTTGFPTTTMCNQTSYPNFPLYQNRAFEIGPFQGNIKLFSMIYGFDIETGTKKMDFSNQ
jgi:hypothetical protein